MKKISLSVLLVTLCGNLSSNLETKETEHTMYLIQAIDEGDANYFFSILQDSNNIQNEIQALLDRNINSLEILNAISEEILDVPYVDILLSLMTRYGDIPSIKLLLKNNANPNFFDPFTSKNLLEMAQELNNEKVIQLLKKHGAIDTPHKAKYTKIIDTPHKAKYTKILSEAIKNQDGNKLDKTLKNLGYYGSGDDILREVKSLIDSGIKLSSPLKYTNEYQETTSFPLIDYLLSWIVSHNEEIPTVEFLLKNGANPNFKDPTYLNMSLLKKAQSFPIETENEESLQPEDENERIIQLLKKYGATE